MRILHFLVFLFFMPSTLHAQDTLKVTLPQADSLLVARNLSLIASQYKVDKAQAGIVQARLFNNPELATEWSLRNPQNNEWLDIGPRGHKIIALEQVFRIAGQRSTGIRLAEGEKRLSELQFQELARALKHELHIAFYRYHFLDNAISNIRSQLGLLKRLIDVYGEQYRKGNISLQELTRLNTTYFTINSQVTDVQRELVSLQERLKILLAEERYVLPVDDAPNPMEVTHLSLPLLIEKALENRIEIKALQAEASQHQLRYSLARKERVPDITAGILYDQAGSYVDHYTGVTLGLKIPVFDRNQGRIQAARIDMLQTDIALSSKRKEIAAEVESAWNVLHILLEQYNAVPPDYENELDLLSEGLVNNYGKNNISLLEFTDLFEAYNTNIIQYNELKADLRKSYEELLYAVGE